MPLARFLNVYLYLRNNMVISQQLQGGKKKIPSVNNPGKQELSGPLTLLPKIFDQSLSTSPSVVLLI